jgi:hypothetical protein
MKHTPLLLIAAASLALAQSESIKFYRFDFTLKEFDGTKSAPNRIYSANGATRSGAIVIRSGDRVPVVSGKTGETTYLDIGMDIDCRIMSETPNELGISVNANSSSADSRVPPIVTQTKWGSTLVVPLRKNTVLFTSEGGSHKAQLELMITPLQ